jgi:Tfp pilus assembly protein PilX
MTRVQKIAAWSALIAIGLLTLALFVSAAIRTYAVLAFGVDPAVATSIFLKTALYDLVVIVMTILAVSGFRALKKQSGNASRENLRS